MLESVQQSPAGFHEIMSLAVTVIKKSANLLLTRKVIVTAIGQLVVL
jgi:hypothetical protein